MTAKSVVKTQIPLRTNLRRQVLSRILFRRLSPGARVNESSLSSELGVSRTPLREALFSLEQEGFISSEGTRGFSVAALSGREVHEIYPMLWTLEGLALRTTGASALRLVSKLRHLNRLFGASKTARRGCALDRQWHETLISLCPNKRLLNMIAGLRLAASRYEYMYMADRLLIKASVSQHEDIIAAVEQGDSARAIDRLEANWRFGMETLLVRLGEG